MPGMPNTCRLKRRDVLKLGAAGMAGLRASAAAQTTSASAPAEPPAMKVILWCWDARMTWDDEPQAIATKMASPTSQFPYLKKPESYLVGFKRLVDYCAKVGVHSIIVWGFLRDAHGGVKAARELCDYASDRGVGIIPGVGLCSYGGYYFEGDHPFNLGTYIRKHPDRAVLVPRPENNSQPSPILDPSLKTNQDWWRSGLEWMLDNFRIAGINYEMGDFLVNPSDSAVKARAALSMDTDENLQDIVVATRDLARFSSKAFPKGLFINSTYRGYHQIRGFPRMPYIDALPKGVVWQYTLTQMVRRPEFPAGFAGVPPHRRYGYLHCFNHSTHSADRDFTADIARVFPAVRNLGFEFIGTYGEVGSTGNDLADRNYRGMLRWSCHP